MCPLTPNNTVPLNMEAATPTPYKPPAQENLTLSLKEQSQSVIFGPQNRRKKRKNKTKHPDRLAVSMFSLQRQDLLFWSLTQGDHIAAPHKHCRQVSSRPYSSLSSFFWIPQTLAGIEGIHPWLPLRCSLGSGCSVSLQKSWSHSQVELSTRWGPGIQGLCFKTLAHWELLTSREFFRRNGDVAYISPSTGWMSVITLSFTF